MQELLIVNPARRPSKRRKAASPAQKRARAAFAKMSRARSANPAKRRSRKAVASFLHAPKRRKSVARRANPIRHSRRRRNPLSVNVGGVKPMGMLTPALMGALGAVAVNTIMGKLPIPAKLMTGNLQYVTRAAAAIALGMLAGKVGLKGGTAAQMAEGSLTVTLHDAITAIAAGQGINLSGMGYYLPGVGAQAVPSASGNAGRLMGVGKYMTGPGARNVVPMTRGMAGLARQTNKKSGFNF